MVVLTKTNDGWAVEFELPNYEPDFQLFTAIEGASLFMTKYLNIKDESIDDAIIEMAGFDRTKAIFNSKGLLQETK